jgi:hypothetical protein
MPFLKILYARSGRMQWPPPRSPSTLAVRSSPPRKIDCHQNPQSSSRWRYLSGSCGLFVVVDTRALPTDLPSSIHCAPALNSLASLYNSAFAMGPICWPPGRSGSGSTCPVSSCASSRYRWCASGMTSSPWTSHGSTCIVSTIRCGWLPEKSSLTENGRFLNRQNGCWQLYGIPADFTLWKPFQRGGKFSAQYYTNNIFIAISDWRRLAGERSPNKVWVHAGNARPHSAEVSTDFIALNRMKQARPPPDSPDLVPSDFFLFGYVKRKLMGYHAESRRTIEMIGFLRSFKFLMWPSLVFSSDGEDTNCLSETRKRPFNS